jgi:Methyltransferase domain
LLVGITSFLPNRAGVTGSISCVICSGTAFDRLPDPSPDRCIASDLRVMPEPLDKWQCRTCGAIRRRTVRDVAKLFESDYGLYAHDPGRSPEASRQAGYASWLAEQISAPASCFEAGSGNGSLLLALHQHWNAAMSGVEPAPDAAAAARRAGIPVATSFVQMADTKAPRAGLAFSVNVIEHTEDPSEFLRMLASHGERVAIVCPDASVPNSELLFGDHLHSLRPEHLIRLFNAAGLHVDTVARAPAALGYFQMLVGSHADVLVHDAVQPTRDDGAAGYVEAWRGLDERLIQRLGEGEVIAFGAGEAAGLLRAYAPRAWSRVTACAVDRPDFDRFGDRAVVDAETLQPTTMLLAVRPFVQSRLEARLCERGHRVVRWDDVIER